MAPKLDRSVILRYLNNTIQGQLAKIIPDYPQVMDIKTATSDEMWANVESAYRFQLASDYYLLVRFGRRMGHSDQADNHIYYYAWSYRNGEDMPIGYSPVPTGIFQATGNYDGQNELATCELALAWAMPLIRESLVKAISKLTVEA